ncbi:formamidopyrimidine-DNA glycosylase [Trichoderma cornu-damae]|uniref:Formamidopyrimidine-DNA glycosylase n=1 Tax=Trichoderma cornu-damae TaxID=654480 RepID=A0A9P8QGP0_9HYPO|nr:formamidopyrimidine-DNA glycosylase [Trichoderma cornu-damae]
MRPSFKYRRKNQKSAADNVFANESLPDQCKAVGVNNLKPLINHPVVARIVHYLRQRLVGKTIAKVAAIDDSSVFGKAGTSGGEVEAALKGRTGKYFWYVWIGSGDHGGLLTFGWVHINGERTAYRNYYKKMKESDIAQWPPKFWKFHLSTNDAVPVEVAFTDARRFGRVRLVDCPGESIRKHSPLVENGPDPVVDKDAFTEEYLAGKMKSRHVPIKALLLDQAMISGIGNWVADETLYQARLHPEQYSDTFEDKEVARLHESIRYVCQLAVDKLGESDEFPDHWLFNYRWGKGGKDAATKLPNGEKLAFITVGGRTSCYAPGVQKKTGAVVSGAKAEPVKSSESGKSKSAKGKPAVKGVPKEEEEEEAVEEEKPKRSRKQAAAVKEEPGESEEEEEEEEVPPAKKRRGRAAAEKSKPFPVKKDEAEEDAGRRRSSRLKK